MVDTDPAYLRSVRKLSLAVKVTPRHSCPRILPSAPPPRLALYFIPIAPTLSSSPSISLSPFLIFSSISVSLSLHPALPPCFLSFFPSFSRSSSASVFSGCQAPFRHKLYMPSLSMPSQIQRDSSVFLSERRGKSKTEEDRGIKEVRTRSRNPGGVQTLRCKLKNNIGLGKFLSESFCLVFRRKIKN